MVLFEKVLTSVLLTFPRCSQSINISFETCDTLHLLLNSFENQMFMRMIQFNILSTTSNLMFSSFKNFLSQIFFPKNDKIISPLIYLSSSSHLSTTSHLVVTLGNIYFEVLLISGLKLSRRACLSHKLPPSLGPPSLGLNAGCWGCEPLLDHDGANDSSYAVACLCSLDSRRFILLLHCVVESRRPVFASSNFGLGLVAGGDTELIIIVGIGMD